MLNRSCSRGGARLGLQTARAITGSVLGLVAVVWSPTVRGRVGWQMMTDEWFESRSGKGDFDSHHDSHGDE